MEESSAKAEIEEGQETDGSRYLRAMKVHFNYNSQTKGRE